MNTPLRTNEFQNESWPFKIKGKRKRNRERDENRLLNSLIYPGSTELLSKSSL